MANHMVTIATISSMDPCGGSPQSGDSSDQPLSNDHWMKEFERIYRETVDDVFRYAWRCTGRREIAEEITSDVFLALYRNIAGIQKEWIKPWLFRVTKNHAVDYWRRRDVEQRLAQEIPPPPSVSEPMIPRVILESAELKASHRACLILRYVHGMDREEIAKTTGLTGNQVKSCLQYGLRLLRKHVEATKKGEKS